MALNIETIEVGPLAENCYLVWCDETRNGIFIDPGDEAERLLRTAKQLNVTPVGIYNTHGHFDHVGAAAALQRTLEVPFAIHPSDEPMLKGLGLQTRMFGMPSVEPPTVNQRLKEGDVITFGNQEGRVIGTPGHTEGGVCFLFGKHLFCGDTLFMGSVGRSDLQGGDGPTLLKSIHDKLMVLEPDVRVYPGHGPSTTIATEKRSNPYLRAGSGRNLF